MIGSTRRLLASAGLATAMLAFQITGDTVLASGFSALVVDRSSYKSGDQIRICWLIPSAGTSKLTDTAPDGASTVLRSGPDTGSGCVTGTIAVRLLGRECMLLEFDTARGSGSIQKCFMLVDTTSEEHVVAETPRLSQADTPDSNGSDLSIDGVGFQTFSYAAHGVTIFVKGPAGAEVDSDELFPNADGSLQFVLHTADYPPGEYTVNARYSFVNAVSGRVSAATTQYLTDGLTLSVD